MLREKEIKPVTEIIPTHKNSKFTNHWHIPHVYTVCFMNVTLLRAIKIES